MSKSFLSISECAKFEIIQDMLHKSVNTLTNALTVDNGSRWCISGGIIPHLYEFLTDVQENSTEYQKLITGPNHYRCSKFKDSRFFKDGITDIDLYHIGTSEEFQKSADLIRNKFHTITYGRDNPEYELQQRQSGECFDVIGVENVSKNHVTDKLNIIRIEHCINSTDVSKNFDFISSKPVYNVSGKMLMLTERQYNAIQTKTLVFNKKIKDIRETRLDKWINLYGYSPSKSDCEKYNEYRKRLEGDGTTTEFKCSIEYEVNAFYLAGSRIHFKQLKNDFWIPF